MRIWMVALLALSVGCSSTDANSLMEMPDAGAGGSDAFTDSGLSNDAASPPDGGGAMDGGLGDTGGQDNIETSAHDLVGVHKVAGILFNFQDNTSNVGTSILIPSHSMSAKTPTKGISMVVISF